MHEKRQQLDKRRECLLTGIGTATKGSGSMRGKGASGWEVRQQPAEQERLNKRQSQWMGGYATTSQTGVAQREGRHNKSYLEAGALADYRRQCNRRLRCCLSRGANKVEQDAEVQADGRLQLD
jgi:hypothetical protein